MLCIIPAGCFSNSRVCQVQFLDLVSRSFFFVLLFFGFYGQGRSDLVRSLGS